MVVSASECAASANIAAEPLTTPATIFAIAIVALEASAIAAVRRLSTLRSGRRLRALMWAAARGIAPSVPAVGARHTCDGPAGRPAAHGVCLYSAYA